MCVLFVEFHGASSQVLMVDLHKLALEGDTEGVRKFVTKSSSKVDKKNRDGQTALHCCAKG